MFLKSTVNKLVRLPWWSTLLLLLAIACSGESFGPGDQAGPTDEKAEGQPSIKVYISDAEGPTRLVEFGPAGSATEAEAGHTNRQKSPDGERSQNGANSVGQIRESIVVEYDDDGARKRIEYDGYNPSPPLYTTYPTAWTLVRVASGHCAYEAGRDPMDRFAGMSVWGPGGWYIYSSLNAWSCDDILRIQENMLCTADKLAEVADTVRPLTWDYMQYDIVEGFTGPHEMIIPPQAARDKFIARELALNVIAHLSRLENARPVEGFPVAGVSSPYWSCTDAYHSTAYTGACNECYSGNKLSENDYQLFGVLEGDSIPNTSPEYLSPGTEISVGNLPQLFESRLQMKAHILRAAGRLLRDLVTKSVQDDLSGAERARAARGSTTDGAKEAWGVGTSASTPYNSLRHALRVLYGRLELSTVPWQPTPDVTDLVAPSREDRKCNGYTALGSLDFLALASGFSARWEDVAPRTPEQSLSSSILHSAGIVILPSVLDGTEREAIIEQLQIDAAGRAGIDPVDDASEYAEFVASAAGESVRKLIGDGGGAGLSDEDIRFGLARTYVTYRLLTDTSAGVAPSSIPGFTKAGSRVGSKLVALGGIAMDGGLRTEDLYVDPAATVGKASMVSQCNEPPHGYPHGANWYTRGFQDVFALASQFKTQLKKTKGTPASDEVADLGLAEFEGLTEGTVTLNADHPTLEISTAPELLLSWLGTDDPQDAFDAGRVALVHGEPWDADCAAGVRVFCPDPEPNVVWPLEAGSDVAAGKLTFAPPAGVYPVANSFYTGGSSVFYLVIRPEAGAGSVVATFPSKGSGRFVYDVSSVRRELTRRVFGISRASEAADACGADADRGVPSGYCIAGMERDMFVPLANELTSESGVIEDSWRHYLRLAKESSAKADELGRQMIEIGLQQDLRREQAQEELAGLCGSYSSASDLAFSEGGDLESSETNSEISACIHEPSVPVVFFGKRKEKAEAHELVQKYACTGASGSSLEEDVCEATEDDFEDTSFQAGLNFDTVGSAQAGAGVADICDSVKSFYGTFVRTGQFDELKFKQFEAAGLFEPSIALGSITRLEMIEDIDGVSWKVLLAGTPLFVWRSVPETMPAGGLGDLVHYPVCKALPFDCDGESCCSAQAKAIDVALRTSPQYDQSGNQVAGDFTYEDAGELRAQLQSALWDLGQSAGKIPAGTFHVPVPVAWFHDGDPDPAPAVVAPAIYGPGQFRSAGFLTLDTPMGYQINAVGDEEAVYVAGSATQLSVDYSILGPALALKPEFASARQHLGPLWRRDLYSQVVSGDYLFGSASYLTVWARNSEISFNDEGFTGDAYTDVRLTACGGFLSPFGKVQGVLSVFDDSCAGGPPLGGIVSAIGATHQGRGRHDPLKEWRPASCAETGYVTRDCALATDAYGSRRTWNKTDGDCDWATSNFTADALKAEACSPGDRVTLFLDKDADADARKASQLMLTCMARDRSALSAESPPVIDSVEDIALLRGWLEEQANIMAKTQEEMFVLNVPRRVVEYFDDGRVPNGVVGGGTRGSQILQLAKDFEDIYDGFGTIADGFRRMATAVDAAELALEAADLANQREVLGVAYRKIDLHRQMALAAVEGTLGAAAAGIHTYGIGAAAGVASAAINMNAALEQLDLLEGEEALSAAQHANNLSGALLGLNTGMAEGMEVVRGGISQIKEGNLSALQQLNGIRQGEADAKFHAAKATAADYYTTPDGELVTMPVNTVYRRNYDITRRRYERVLESAKRYAYLARLSIEQRLGIRMSSLDEKIGVIDPPSGWIDDVCSLQGVDYEALRSAKPDSGDITGGASTISEEDVVQGFADQYIGDYVDKLAEFVEYYNIQYPFHESDDFAVVSLRDELVFGDQVCVHESHNKLFHSDALYRSPPYEEAAEVTPADDEELSQGGWTVTGCRSDACLTVGPGRYVSDEGADDEWVDIVPPGGEGGVSLLRTDVLDPTDLSVVPEPEDLESTLPPTIAYQSVRLLAGKNYRLSWWDMARGTSGEPAESSQAYRVVVYDQTWSPVSLTSFTAAPGGTTDEWSARRVVEFQAYDGGYYHIGVEATDGPYGTGAIALANLQLTDVAEVGAASEVYEQTTASRMIVGEGCETGNAGLFREAFVRRCDGEKCFYELEQPIVIRSGEIADGKLSLTGLAANNFNYRHVGVALNVVGSGVLDCSGSIESCYANSFLEYDLQHAAFKAEIEDYGGDKRCFSFGRGNIRHAKALAAERYLGVPLGSADASMVERPEFMKPIFHGRPLSGTYKLRIHDAPGLDWDKIDDIQLVLKYRYWARVDRAPSQ